MLNAYDVETSLNPIFVHLCDPIIQIVLNLVYKQVFNQLIKNMYNFTALYTHYNFALISSLQIVSRCTSSGPSAIRSDLTAA